MSTRQRAIKWMWRKKNVVKMFEHFSQKLVNINKCFGINFVRERVRWECIFDYRDETYKFPNDFSPYVARYLLSKHPDWSKYIKCRLTKDETDKIILITDEDLEKGNPDVR